MWKWENKKQLNAEFGRRNEKKVEFGRQRCLTAEFGMRKWENKKQLNAEFGRRKAEGGKKGTVISYWLLVSATPPVADRIRIL